MSLARRLARCLGPLALVPVALLALAACGDDTDGGSGASGGSEGSGGSGGSGGSDSSGTSAVVPGEKASVSGSAEAAIAAVNEIAPALESEMRGDPYAQTLDEAAARIDDIGLTPAAPLRVAGYRYDADQVEFTLCVEDAETGAYATYDTAPMSVRQTGESGGCGAADLGQ